MKSNVIGMDIAKLVFQLHTVDSISGEIIRTKLRRAAVLRFLAQHPPALVAIEACCSEHHWARRLHEFGSWFVPPVRTTPALSVKATT